MKQMATVSGDVLEGVSATTLWALHNRGTVAKRSGGVIRDPWAVTLFDAISCDYRKFGRPNLWKLWATWSRLDRLGFMRRIRPRITLLEFG
jgi:O-methyltransferase involved in polyketide biosynthesis